MLFPSLGAQIGVDEIQCLNHKWRVLCSKMTIWVAKMGDEARHLGQHNTPN